MSAFENQATPENQNPESSTAFADQLKSITNESGEQKYDSVEKAIEALKHSQNYIPELKTNLTQKEQEIENLKAELAKRQSVEEVVEKFSANQEASQEITPQAAALDEQAVLNLVKNFTQEQSTMQTAQQNEESVSNALFEAYGEKTREVVSAKAQELGMTVESLQNLSRTSPAAALQLFQAAQERAPKTTVGSVSIPPNRQQEEGLAPPEKNLLQGASTKDQVDYLRQIREKVYKKYDITV